MPHVRDVSATVVKVSITITAQPVRSCLKEGRTFYMQGMMTWEDLVEPIYQEVMGDHKSRRWSEIRIVP